MLAKGHVLLEDFPGLGKTLAARSWRRCWASTSPGRSSPPTCCRPTSPARSSTTSATATFEFRRGPLFTGLLLADEINRTPPKTQSALLEAMQERQVTVEGETFPLPEPFHVLATANPIEYEGTYPLPEAQLDRFLLRVSFGYPTADEEYDVVQRRLERRSRRRSTSTRSPTPPGCGRCRRRSRRSPSTSRVGRYCVDLATATRDHNDVLTGVVAARLARPGAGRPRRSRVIRGRDYVIPEDVKAVARAGARRTGSRSSPSSG